MSTNVYSISRMPTNVYSSAPWAETCTAKTGECLLTFTHPLPDGGGEHGERETDRLEKISVVERSEKGLEEQVLGAWRFPKSPPAIKKTPMDLRWKF